jgi:hypothetical protein
MAMTVTEVIEAWRLFPKLGKVSFLLESQYMKIAYPEDNTEFIDAIDMVLGARFDELPGDLQNVFRGFMDTPRYGIWRKKGGD